ncbi:hypothetical protein QPK87_02175 [Kamptonema cortianum]|nr:hypothetical protein [Kamptonema cortianum]MDL5046142.1 hypothetical protein [Oscillatoria amoena NRMC-F 0135]
METLNILIVGDPGSIHTARFALLLQEAGHRVHCFQSELYYSQDEHLRNLPLHVAYLDRPPPERGHAACCPAVSLHGP